MAATIISNSGQYTWGMLTNRMTSGLITANTAIARLGEAIATASVGFDGTDGTQFEISPNANTSPTPPNLFGVVADLSAPGEKGKDYAYAVGQLKVAWDKFWTEARPYIEQLDNGTQSL